MIDDYCPVTLDGAPAHRCLCYHPPGHHGGHECRCGHYWGIDWDAMSYDQQWRFLGLPAVRPWTVGDMRELLLREWVRRALKWTIEIGEPHDRTA